MVNFTHILNGVFGFETFLKYNDTTQQIDICQYTSTDDGVPKLFTTSQLQDTYTERDDNPNDGADHGVLYEKGISRLSHDLEDNSIISNATTDTSSAGNQVSFSVTPEQKHKLEALDHALNQLNILKESNHPFIHYTQNGSLDADEIQQVYNGTNIEDQHNVVRIPGLTPQQQEQCKTIISATNYFSDKQLVTLCSPEEFKILQNLRFHFNARHNLEYVFQGLFGVNRYFSYQGKQINGHHAYQLCIDENAMDAKNPNHQHIVEYLNSMYNSSLIIDRQRNSRGTYTIELTDAQYQKLENTEKALIILEETLKGDANFDTFYTGTHKKEFVEGGAKDIIRGAHINRNGIVYQGLNQIQRDHLKQLCKETKDLDTRNLAAIAKHTPNYREQLEFIHMLDQTHVLGYIDAPDTPVLPRANVGHPAVGAGPLQPRRLNLDY